MAQKRETVDDEILTPAQAARLLGRSLSWLQRSNAPVAILPGRGEGKRAGKRLYLRSELIAWVRQYLTHTATAPVADPRPHSSLRRTG